MLVFCSSPAAAQSDEALAEVLFKQGRDAFESGDYEKACAKFEESYRIEATVGTQLNLAACEEKRGRIATAWGLFRAVQRKLPANDPRGAFADKNVKSLALRVPHVTFVLKAGAPADTEVNIGEVQVKSGAFGEKLPFDPGEHKWIVSAPGYLSRTLTLHLKEKADIEVLLFPGDKQEVVSPNPQNSPPPYLRDTEESNFNRRTASYALAGVGVAAVASASIFGVMTLNKRSAGNASCPSVDDCSEAGAKALDQARGYRLATNVSWVVAALSMGTATYFYFTVPDDDKESARNDTSFPRPRLSLGLGAAPLGAAISIRGAFD